MTGSSTSVFDVCPRVEFMNFCIFEFMNFLRREAATADLKVDKSLCR